MSTKTSVLALLESSRGQSLSGAHMAQRLNLSRNAVWKAVKELEKDGYVIQAVRNKGYMLLDDNDIVSVQGIEAFLPRNCGPVYVYETLESTLKTGKEMAISGAGHGTVIVANGQTLGRGRFGRSFYSPSGLGIYMSFVLRPEKLAVESSSLVTAFAAVCVCEAIEALTGKSPGIKWVNDIILEGRKICGILTEAVMDLESGGVQWMVLGIGINFSAKAADFPEDLRQTAGSLFMDKKPDITRNRLIAEIAGRITPENPCSREEIIEKYRRRIIMLDRKIRVMGAGEEYEATAVDIDGNGGLMVRLENGEIRTLSSGEVSTKIGL